MKTLHYSITFLITGVLLFSIIPLVSHIAFGSQQNTTDGYVHYGPSRQSIPSYLVSPPSNTPLEDQLGNPTKTILVHDNAILILNQTTPKLIYKIGENITINTELTNVGNKTVEIKYCIPLVVFEIKNQAGDEIWPNSQVACVPELTGKKTLQPSEHISVQPWGESLVPHYIIPSPSLYNPGKYTVLAVAVFTFNPDSKSLGPIESLWSKPLQITVLPEFPSTTTLVTENQTTNQSSLQDQIDLAKQKTEEECIGGSGMCPAEQKLIKEKENNQKLILVLAIGIPAIAASVIFLMWRKQKTILI